MSINRRIEPNEKNPNILKINEKEQIEAKNVETTRKSKKLV